MKKYLCTHTFPKDAFSKAQVCQIADAAQHDSLVRGYRSFLNFSEGKGCCVFEAEDREAVVDWFGKMNIPYDSIVEVEFEGDRGLIEDLRELPVMAGVS
jgi:hypothetical protein